MQDLCLHDIRVLVFINEHMVEPRAYLPGELRVCDEMVPVQQQVIVVECLATLFSRYVVAEQLAKFGLPIGTPGIEFAKHVTQRPLRVDASRIYGQAGVLFWKAARFS